MLRRLFPSTVPPPALFASRARGHFGGSTFARARRVLRSAARVLTKRAARRGAQGYDDSPSPSPSKRPRAGWRDALGGM